MDTSTRHLRAFVALVDCGNFTQAAKRVHLSQPAFSSMIRAIEEAAGFQLVDRSSRQVTLTPAGREFAAIARNMLEDFDAQMASLGDRLDPHGKVSIASMVALSYQLLPPVLANFKALFPKVQLELFATFPSDCLALVRARRVDFAITAAAAGERGIVLEPLFREPFDVVCRADHPLARLEQVPLSMLTEYPFVHYGRATLAREQIDAAVHPRKIQAVNEIEHIHTIRALVESGAGISVAPAITHSIFESNSLALRPIEGDALGRDICLIWHPSHTPGHEAKTLAAMLRAVLTPALQPRFKACARPRPSRSGHRSDESLQSEI
jgi:LysR family carnitine catabolism transcriptional activator